MRARGSRPSAALLNASTLLGYPKLAIPADRGVDFVGWLVVFGLNDPLRQYFSLYRVVSQREGEREEKG